MQEEDKYSKIKLNDKNGSTSFKDVDGNSTSSKDVDGKAMESIEPN